MTDEEIEALYRALHHDDCAYEMLHRKDLNGFDLARTFIVMHDALAAHRLEIKNRADEAEEERLAADAAEEEYGWTR